jgi:hypothetical protein
MQSAPKRYQLDGPQGLRVTADWSDPDERIEVITTLVQGLTTKDTTSAAPSPPAFTRLGAEALRRRH